MKRMSSEEASDGDGKAIADSAVLVEIAADGRMRIPARLLAHAGVTGDVSFSGNIRTITLSPMC